jgi:hypothetical protein
MFILCFNALNSKTFFSSQHITSHRTCTSRPAAHAHAHAHRTARPAGRPRRAAPRLGLGHGHGHGPARRGEASERARVWFTVLLLPASQVVYKKSTF